MKQCFRPLTSLGIGAALVALSFVAASAEAAGSHRATLSKDLAERLAAGDQSAARVIVTGTPQQIQILAQRYGAQIKKQLRNGAVLEVSGGQLDALSQDDDVSHISSDAPVRRMMAVTGTAIGADQLWASAFTGTRGYTGRGVGVAVIDSGVAPHEALARRVVVSVDFTDTASANDGYGHGTHVAGIIAGAGENGGIAPSAHLINLRAIGDDGSGTTSDVIEAIDWAIEERRRYNIRVINLSLGKPVLESYRDDPLCLAVVPQLVQCLRQSGARAPRGQYAGPSG